LFPDQETDENEIAMMTWLSLGRTRRRPDRVERLSRKNKSSVYRLVYANHPSVIAKRCMHWGLRVERTVYEHVSKRLPVRMPAYYGCVEEDNGEFYWLFLEDIGGVAYDHSQREHQMQAAGWLARVHSASALPKLRKSFPMEGPQHYVSQGPDQRLPDRGAAYYRTTLERGMERILSRADDAGFSTRQRNILKRIIHLMDAAEQHWPALEVLCANGPRVVTHGDFVPKNLRVGCAPDAGLAAFDWESAGWASPAMDCRIFRNADEAVIETYCANLGGNWPGVDTKLIRRFICLGVLCRALASVYWQAEMLDDPATWDDLQTYANELSATLPILRGA
jgi:hypothetical protein